MIGRFSRGLGDRPVPLVAAGAILVVLGLWNGGEALLASYPDAQNLELVEGTAFDAIEVVRKRGALTRFLTGPSLEFQAVLDPGEVLVLYRDNMPRYEEVKAAVAAGPAVYGLWPEAPADDDRHRIWSLEGEGGVVVGLEDTVSGLRAVRSDSAMLPGALAVVGVVLALVGLRRWRARG